MDLRKMSDFQSVLEFPLSIGRKLLSSSPKPSYVNEATFDPDRLVVFAVVALLCLLIFVIALYWLLRCLLRCRGRMVLDSSEGVANTGLKKAAMKALPTTVYTATSKPRPVPTDCPICLAEFAEGQKIRVLPRCNHGFHVECIDKWLVCHSSCPMCRHCLILHSRNKNPEGSAVARASEPNNSMHIVIESTTDSIQAIGVVSPDAETFKQTPQEAAVTTPSESFTVA
jgi:E3 ubiquitin-protein ligase ATL10/75/76/77/78